MNHVALAAPCGTMTVRFQGAVTPEAVWKMLARVGELACDHVIVDLSQAGETPDVALAFLAGGLASIRPSHVGLRGLGPSQQHLLDTLGARWLVVA